MTRDHIDARGFTAILILTMLWGLNYAAIKCSNAGLSPIFTTLLRSVTVSVFGIIYCLIIKQQLFHGGILLFHGAIVGLLFGLGFVCLYPGMLYTDAARSVILIYLSPFVVAIGAHLLLKEELTFGLVSGLILVCTGIYCINYRK